MTSKISVVKSMNALAKKMLISNRIVLLSLFRTSLALLGLLVGLFFLLMPTPYVVAWQLKLAT